MKPEQLTVDGQEIRRLLGDGLSADGLAAALSCLYQKLKQDMADRPAPVGQVWAKAEDVATMYGLGSKQVHQWLNKARASGKVRVQRPSGGSRGVYYNIADLYNLWEVEPVKSAANK